MIVLIDTLRDGSPLDKAVAGFVRNLYGKDNFTSPSDQIHRLHLRLIKPPISNKRSQVSASIDLCLTTPASCSSSCTAQCSQGGCSCQPATHSAVREWKGVRIVYSLHSSNPKETTRAFIHQCPDCNAESPALPSLQAAQQHAQQHAVAGCSKSIQTGGPDASELQRLHSSTGAVMDEEAAEVKLLARVLALAALHIAHLTQPNEGKHMPLAAAAAGAAATPSWPGVPAAAQLKPWRVWAINCLSENEELLAVVTAAWLRPSWHSINLHSRSSSSSGDSDEDDNKGSKGRGSNRGVASLLDAILAPPYIAVMDQAFGTVLEKLAVLLKRHKCHRALQRAAQWQQQQQQQQHKAEADQDSAFSLLADVLSCDPAFSDVQPLPADQPGSAAAAEQRITALLSQIGISSINKVQAAMADYPWITDTHVQVCAVCGLSTGGLRGFRNLGNSTYLRPCSYCVVCVCATCIASSNGLDVEAIVAKEGPAAAAAAAVKAAAETPWPGGLCSWCQEHDDAEGFVSHVNPGPWHHGPATPDMLAAAVAAVPLTIEQQQLLLTWQGEQAWRLSPLPAEQLPPGYIELQLQPGSHSRHGAAVLLVRDQAGSLFVAPDGTVTNNLQQAWEDADKTALREERKHAAKKKAMRQKQQYQQQQQYQYQIQYGGNPVLPQRQRRGSSSVQGGMAPTSLAAQQNITNGTMQAERAAAAGGAAAAAVHGAAQPWATETSGKAGQGRQQAQTAQQQQQQQQLDQQSASQALTTFEVKQPQQQVSRASPLLPEVEHNLQLQELQKMQQELEQLQQGFFGTSRAAGGGQEDLGAAGGDGTKPGRTEATAGGDGDGDGGATAAAAGGSAGGAAAVKAEPEFVWLTVDSRATDDGAMHTDTASAGLRPSQVHNLQQQTVVTSKKRSRDAKQQPSSSGDAQQAEAKPGSSKKRRVAAAAACASKGAAQQQQQQQQQQHATAGSRAGPTTAADATAAADITQQVAAANKNLAKRFRQLQALQELLQSLQEPQDAASAVVVKQLLGEVSQKQQLLLLNNLQESAEASVLGLQVLHQVLEALTYVPGGGSSRAAARLAQCLLQPVEEGCVAEHTNSGKLIVLDVLLYCWRVEVQETGCPFEDAPRAAGMPVDVLISSSSSSCPDSRVKKLLAGMCQLVYAIVVECYCTPEASSEANSRDEVAVHEVKLSLAVVLLQGTAMLLMHWPKDAGASRAQHALQWRRQLADLAGVCHVADRLSSMLRQLQQQVRSMKDVCTQL